MINLTVTEDEFGAGIQQLRIDDILFMQFDNGKNIVVFTESKQYYTVGPLRFWESALEKGGANFLRIDRGILVNVDRVKAVDLTFHLAYFDLPITKTTKRCTMSYTGYKALREKIALGVMTISQPF